MRRTRQTALRICIVFARPVLAAALLFSVLSGALPAEAALNPKGLMPCCRGMKGTAGECHGNSCPMHFGARKKSFQLIQRDPVCGAERVLQAIASTPLHAPTDYLEQARSHRHTQADVEHDHGRSVSPRNTPPSPRQPFAVGASLGQPCPPNCCGAVTGSFAGLRRPKQLAALTDGLRPRPPTVESHRHGPSAQLKVASALRRSHPTRSPPTILNSRTA